MFPDHERDHGATGSLSSGTQVGGAERMSMIKDIVGRFGIAGELISFLWVNKLWWMIPMMVVLLLFGAFIVLSQTTAIGPFIYTLF